MTNIEYNSTNEWIWFAVYMVYGIGFAFIFMRCKPCVGVIMGGYLGSMISNLIITGYVSTNGVPMVWWGKLIAIGCCIAAGVIVGCCCYSNIVLLGITVIGGYCFVSGLGTLIGQWPYSYYPTAVWVWWTYFSAMWLLII